MWKMWLTDSHACQLRRQEFNLHSVSSYSLKKTGFHLPSPVACCTWMYVVHLHTISLRVLQLTMPVRPCGMRDLLSNSNSNVLRSNRWSVLSGCTCQFTKIVVSHYIQKEAVSNIQIMQLYDYVA